MAIVTLQGSKSNTNGTLPKVHTKAPDFDLIAKDLSVKSLDDYLGKKLVLNIFPSVDTGVCAASVRNFNKKASSLENTVVLCISRDLPFTQSRFCGAENIENVEMLSDFEAGRFGKNYGLEFIDGPFKGLHSRCIIVINEKGQITYTEQVPEISNEPNYDAAIKAL